MPGWLKALLIVIVAIFVLAIGVVALAGYIIYRNKDAVIAKTKQIGTEAKEFGEKTDNQGCVDESIARYKAEPGFTKAISTSIFMRICLDNSRPTPGFCGGLSLLRRRYVSRRPAPRIRAAAYADKQCGRVCAPPARCYPPAGPGPIWTRHTPARSALLSS